MWAWVLYKNTEVHDALYAVSVVGVEISGCAGDSDGDGGVQVFLYCAGHGFGAFGGVDAVDFDDGRVDADEDFGFVQIRDVAAGENGGGASVSVIREAIRPEVRDFPWWKWWCGMQ